ncbi:MAG: hypothetical protein WAN93_01010 [Solirubrobacteraceae bacterium]
MNCATQQTPKSHASREPSLRLGGCGCIASGLVGVAVLISAIGATCAW